MGIQRDYIDFLQLTQDILEEMAMLYSHGGKGCGKCQNLQHPRSISHRLQKGLIQSGPPG